MKGLSAAGISMDGRFTNLVAHHYLDECVQKARCEFDYIEVYT
jgi:hypothetical protein